MNPLTNQCFRKAVFLKFVSGEYLYKKNTNFEGLNALFIEGKPLLNRMLSTSKIQFETLAVTSPKPFVYHVELNRPDQLNAMNKPMWL